MSQPLQRLFSFSYTNAPKIACAINTAFLFLAFQPKKPSKAKICFLTELQITLETPWTLTLALIELLRIDNNETNY